MTTLFCPDYPLWDALAPGPYGVGYVAHWRLDHARTFAPRSTTAEEEKAGRPRPLLLAVWYPTGESAPTKGIGMPYGDYFTRPVQTADEHVESPWLGEFARRLMAHNADMTRRYGLGLMKDEPLTPEQEEWTARWKETPTLAVPDAAAAPGLFPMVLYHPGLGSSYEDNAGLCEYLATHGYVVVAGAFSPHDADRLAINGDYDRSFRDFAFLINAAAGVLPSADPSRVAVMGHSYGGHASTAFGAEAACAVDAVVSLDSTVEYQSPESDWAKGFRARLVERAKNVTIPLLLASGRLTMVTIRDGSDVEEFAGSLPPRFGVYDALPHASRWYATVAHLDHNAFASSGVMWRPYRKSRWMGMADAATVRATFAELCLLVRRFLDAALQGDATADAELHAHAVGAPPPLATGEDGFVPRGEERAPITLRYDAPAAGNDQGR